MAAIVQFKIATAFADPLVAVLDAPVTSGNALVVCIMQIFDTIVSVTDDQTGSYTNDYVINAGAWSRHAYSRFGITDGPDTVTVDVSGTQGAMAVFEVSGLTSYDTGAAGNEGDTTTAPSATATAAGANSVGFFIAMNSGAVAYTPPGGWSSSNGGAGGPGTWDMLYNADLGAAGSKTCTATTTSADHYNSIVIYNASAGGGGPSIPILTHHIRQQS